MRKTTVSWISSLHEFLWLFRSNNKARRHEKTKTPWLKLERISAVVVVYITITPPLEMQLYISQKINQIVEIIIKSKIFKQIF
ncbi:unnamed protein product [Brassica rapa subsp. narinosa]